ncbi:MAG: cryptochrome/photolyase family protein [Verrucomicrobia bacterium]|nr:cryptochrome/photolyase family protein [Verrucomicrobiota bacterium]
METIWLMGDHLSPTHPGLAGGPRPDAVVLFIESRKRGGWLRYHQQKLVLIYSAMRHFAADLRAAGWQVDYHRLADTPDFLGGLERHLERHRSSRVLLLEPNDWPTTQAVAQWRARVQVPLELLPNHFFLCGREEFRRWAGSSKRLLMENHYRRLRREHGILVDERGDPEGGAWNYDADNRHTFAQWTKERRGPAPPPRREEPDACTREVMAEVAREFADHPGRADGFWLPVDRAGALRWLRQFVDERLAGFGPYEDLMSEQDPQLHHSVLSPLLNIGLLSPRECLDAALEAYRAGRAPLSSVEGFVRQILGWREFVNGIYWLKMPDYVEQNALGASRPLPAWFYSGQTEMNCLRRCLGQVIDTAYNHHIQRLMVLGNFVMLADIAPREVLRWFLEMYCDAFDWVMAANVIGMILQADGGFMATKPYVAGSGYISKMSDYCSGCRYRPAVKTGPQACPFNYLYWAFFDRHAAVFERNPRVAMAVRSWRNKAPAEQQAIRASAAMFLAEHVPEPPAQA